MPCRPVRIRWAPKVPVAMIVRLYTADGAGIHDDELLADIGARLYERCRSVLLCSDSRVSCPACGTEFEVAWLGRPPVTVSTCPACGWSTTASAYHASFEHQDVLGGNARPAFARYVERYPHARGYRPRLRVVDELVHATHAGGNTACRNLLEGRRHRGLVEELDALSGRG